MSGRFRGLVLYTKDTKRIEGHEDKHEATRVKLVRKQLNLKVLVQLEEASRECALLLDNRAGHERSGQRENQMLKKCVIVAAVALMLAPGKASADWLFTPNIGAGFGGAASGREHLTYGASIGWMGAGVFG